MTGLDSVCFASGFILFCLKRCKDFFCSSVCVCGRGRSKGGGGGLINVIKRQSIDKVSFFLACAYLESCKPRSRK